MIIPLVRTSLLTTCSLILLVVGSTILAGGTLNIANAQSLERINGNGDLVSNLVCGDGALAGPIEISFSAERDLSGVITDGEFSIFVIGDNIWSGDISDGSWSSHSFLLECSIETGDLVCPTIPTAPIVLQIGDLVELSGECGDDVNIEFSASDSQTRGAFTGNVDCIVDAVDPATAIQDIIADVRSLDGANFFTKIVLNSQLRLALLFYVNIGADFLACRTMNSFIASVEYSENRGRMTEMQADDLIQQAEAIKGAIGCFSSSAMQTDEAEAAITSMNSMSESKTRLLESQK